VKDTRSLLVLYISMGKKTSNAHLQATLDHWVGLLQQAHLSPSVNMGGNKEQLIDQFVRSFVPLDVEEADIEHYSGSLKTDEVLVIKMLIDILIFIKIFDDNAGVFFVAVTRIGTML
jgi:hypothetical protein